MANIKIGKYITAVPYAQGERKTQSWQLNSNGWLGDIKWYSPWRRYSFFPSSNNVFEHECLRAIADFCEQQTKDYKESRRG